MSKYSEERYLWSLKCTQSIFNDIYNRFIASSLRFSFKFLDFGGLENRVLFFDLSILLDDSIAHAMLDRPENVLIRECIITSIRHMEWKPQICNNLPVLSQLSFFVFLGLFTTIKYHTKHFWCLFEENDTQNLQNDFNQNLRLLSNNWLSQKSLLLQILGLWWASILGIIFSLTHISRRFYCSGDATKNWQYNNKRDV